MVGGVQQGAGSGHLVGGTEKVQFHDNIPFLMVYMLIIAQM